MKIHCPYCNQHKWIGVDTDHRSMKYVTTCLDDGNVGCEKEYVVDLKVTKKVTTLKIEGEDKDDDSV